MTDPTYAKQVIAFTFPHIGNVGANDEDVEAARRACARLPGARGGDRAVSNYRANQGFAEWMAKWGRIGIAGVDTRALTRLVRTRRAADDRDRASRGRAVRSGRAAEDWRRTGRGSRAWTWRRRSAGCRSSAGPAGSGLGAGVSSMRRRRRRSARTSSRSIMARSATSSATLVEAGARVTVVPASASFDEIMAHEPDGFFLSNGPGRPGGDGRICGAGDPGDAGDEEAAVRHLPRPPDAGARGRRQDVKDVPGPPRRQPPGQAPRRRPGRDHQHEPRLRGRARGDAGQCARDPRVAVRRLELRDRADRPPGVQRAIPPRGEPGAAGQLLSVREVRGRCECGSIVSTAAALAPATCLSTNAAC